MDESSIDRGGNMDSNTRDAFDEKLTSCARACGWPKSEFIDMFLDLTFPIFAKDGLTDAERTMKMEEVAPELIRIADAGPDEWRASRGDATA